MLDATDLTEAVKEALLIACREGYAMNCKTAEEWSVRLKLFSSGLKGETPERIAGVVRKLKRDGWNP